MFDDDLLGRIGCAWRFGHGEGYHWRRARARERIDVAIRFISRTKISKTAAVPYWMPMGIPGTCVETTNKWYGKAMVGSSGELGSVGK